MSKIIDGFEISVNHLGNGVQKIEIITPEKVKFSGNIRLNQLIDENIAYNEIWLKNKNQFVIET